MRTVDCRYSISEERIRAYLQVPEIERLRWLDELVRFTLMWRAAPESPARTDSLPGAAGPSGPTSSP
jgi:hypothetical protein